MRFLNKLKIHQKIFLFSILIMFSIALFDILSMNSGVFGTPADYTSGNYTEGWWNLFFQFNSILIILISLSYYFFSRQDKSEAISLVFGSYILWYFGLADIIYFWLQGKAVPLILSHLNNHIIIGNISKMLGFSYVTNVSLFISVGIGLMISYFIIKFLEEKM